MGYKIEYIEDSYECDDCGTSFASGYKIYKNGELVINKTPVAVCYGGADYDIGEAPFDILKLEGIDVETEWLE